MDSSQKSNKFFDFNSFELMKNYQEKYFNSCNNIYNSQEHKDFSEKVEQPFNDFCNLIHQQIPNKIAFNKFHGEIKVKKELFRYYNMPRLYRYLDIFSTLYIEMTDLGIKIEFVYETGEILAQAIGGINPLIMSKIVAKNIRIFHDLCFVDDNSLFWKKDEILNASWKDLIDDFNQWFQDYLPFLWLAVSNELIPSISKYINPNNPNYSLNNFAQDIGYIQADLERWIRTINRKYQAILYGSPGTGKTYIAEKLAQYLIGCGDGFSELVQFHPAYSYEDFIQGIRPQSQNGILAYPLVPGRFLEFCKKAESREDTCVLIIDEINRANLAQVFGELMYLLEYRDKEIPLAGGNNFRIPKNVRIIGTMNTADRSIANIDHALRRRFAFIELRPNYDVLRRYHLKTGFAVEGLINILQQLNQAIADKNYEIGISFFLTDNLREDIEDIWRMEIEPYLEEYFFNQLKKVDEFRWDKIKNKLWI